MTSTTRIVWSSLLCCGVLLVGCATTGVGSGQLMSPAGSTANLPVRFTWRAEAEPTRGTIEAILPDGRAFEGDFIQVSSALQSEELAGGYDASGYARNYSGRVIGQLHGPGNQRMRCFFQLAAPEQGPVRGGQGQCELSTGEHIDYAELRGGH